MGSFCYTVQNTPERKAEGGAHGAEVDRSGSAGLIPDAAALGENRQAPREVEEEQLLWDLQCLLEKELEPVNEEVTGRWREE